MVDHPSMQERLGSAIGEALANAVDPLKPHPYGPPSFDREDLFLL